MTTHIRLDVAVRARARVGEGPVWDGRTGELHWVDILAGEVHTTTPADAWRTRTTTCPTWIGAVAPRDSTGLVAATRDGFAVIDADGDYEDRLPFLPDGVRMNDGACDAAGRFWAGSNDEGFAPGRGALHVLEPDWTCRTVLDGLTLPNGIGWSPGQDTLYLADTMEHVIWAFDFDVAAGALRRRRPFVVLPATSSLPDGLCVDAAGDVWVAMWGGARVDRYAPDGTLKDALDLPVRQPSSCAFAGPDLATLIVTSACEGLDGTEGLDGSLLAISGLDVAGRPDHVFAG